MRLYELGQIMKDYINGKVEGKMLDYFSEHFCNVRLESPLFYNSPVGLRFELGVPYRGVRDHSYFTIYYYVQA